MKKQDYGIAIRFAHGLYRILSVSKVYFLVAAAGRAMIL